MSGKVRIGKWVRCGVLLGLGGWLGTGDRAAGEEIRPQSRPFGQGVVTNRLTGETGTEVMPVQYWGRNRYRNYRPYYHSYRRGWPNSYYYYSPGYQYRYYPYYSYPYGGYRNGWYSGPYSRWW